jgi:transcriptional regulator with XRE-family HTH domain
MTPYEDVLKAIGHRISHVRKQVGMTQAELARKAGVSLKFMSMMESGANVSLKTLLSVTDALGMDLKDILKIKGLPKGGRGKRATPITSDDLLQDTTAKELVRRISLMTPDQRKRALKILKTALAAD